MSGYVENMGRHTRETQSVGLCLWREGVSEDKRDREWFPDFVEKMCVNQQEIHRVVA